MQTAPHASKVNLQIILDKLLKTLAKSVLMVFIRETSGKRSVMHAQLVVI
jgi:hypothetical protein